MAGSPDRPPGAWVTTGNAALLTDLYELTMGAAYFAQGMDQPATFDLFVRKLPHNRNFLVACGLEQALDYLATMRFDDAALEYLRSLELFGEDFLERLGAFRFTGDVWAVPEGEVVFADEPLVSVTAPMVEAQLVETFLLATVLFQTMVASKAARVAIACGPDHPFADFSARRDHGADAALKAARAAYVVGAASTSNVLAGHLFDIPVSGTMAHAYVMAFESEADAFRSFARMFPDNAVLLIDTYDTEQGARIVVDVASDLARDEIRVRGVRLDSGDLGHLSVKVRQILDEGGLGDVRIVASGDLDEHAIAALVGAGAPIDSYGVGTRMGTSADEPWLGGVYKLVEDGKGPKMKLSVGKPTLPGRKQVYRFLDGEGRLSHDTVALRDEEVPEDGRPLLIPVMRDGRILRREPLTEIRSRAASVTGSLPDDLRDLDRRRDFSVRRSAELEELVGQLERLHA